MVSNILLISLEEREGTAGTVGPRQSTCLSPTDTNLLLWRDLVLICLLLLDRLKYILVAHLVDLKFLLVTDRTRALVMPHTTSKVSERGHFILPEPNLLRILLKQNTALLSTFRPYVRHRRDISTFQLNYLMI